MMGGLGGRRRSEGGSGGIEMERYERLEIDRYFFLLLMFIVIGDLRYICRGCIVVCSFLIGNFLVFLVNFLVGEVFCSCVFYIRGKGV